MKIVAALAISLLLTASCRPGSQSATDSYNDRGDADTLRLVHLDVDGETRGIEGTGPSAERVEESIRGELTAAEHWESSGPGTPVSGRITWFLIDDAAHGDDLIVVWSAWFEATDDSLSQPIELEAATMIPRASFYANQDAEMDEAVSQVVQMLDDAALVFVGEDDELLELIATGERAVVPMALHEAQRRRLSDALRLALELLDPREPQIFVAAAGTIAHFGDRSHVQALIDPIDTQEDVQVLISVLPAIDRLGGPQAVGFLQTLANAHGDPRVRALALALLEE